MWPGRVNRRDIFYRFCRVFCKMCPEQKGPKRAETAIFYKKTGHFLQEPETRPIGHYLRRVSGFHVFAAALRSSRPAGGAQDFIDSVRVHVHLVGDPKRGTPLGVVSPDLRVALGDALR